MNARITPAPPAGTFSYRAALAAIPLAPALASGNVDAAHAGSTKVRTYRGPVEHLQHGPVQVTIKVKKNRSKFVINSSSSRDGAVIGGSYDKDE